MSYYNTGHLSTPHVTPSDPPYRSCVDEKDATHTCTVCEYGTEIEPPAGRNEQYWCARCKEITNFRVIDEC
jgi:hypothetical protein